MAVDIPDFSTEDQDDNSVQDLIDKTPVLNAMRDDITQLEKEIFGNIKEVEVNTFDPGRAGNLKVRDASLASGFDGSDTGVRVQDGQKLQVINTDGDDHIIAPNGKLYIHVILPDGTTNYVSADYVRTDYKYKDESEAPEVPKQVPETPQMPKEPETPELPELPEIPETSETMNENPFNFPYFYMDEGTIYIAHEDGSDVFDTIEPILSIEEAYPGLSEYITIFNQAAHSYESSMLFRQWRTLDEEIIAAINNIESLYQELEQQMYAIPRNEDTEKEIIFEIFKKMKHFNYMPSPGDIDAATNQILDNVNEVEKLFLQEDDLSPEQQRAQIYIHSREGWAQNGDSTLVKDFALNRSLETGNFPEFVSIFQENDIYDLFSNNERADFIGIIDSKYPSVFSPEELQDMFDEYSKAYKTLERRIRSHQNIQILEQQKTQINIQRAQAGLPEYTLSEITELQLQTATENLILHELFRAVLLKQDYRGDPNSIQGIYADMVGLAENRSNMGDIFNISDKNISLSQEYGMLALTSLIPVGAGVVAAGLALKVGTGAARAIGLGRATDAAGKITRIPRFVAGSTVSGAAFYETSNVAQNALRMNPQEAGNYFEGWDDTKEIGKSVAFFGALRIVGGISQLGTVSRFTSKIPTQTLRTGISLSAEAAALVGVSQAIEYSFDGGEDFEGFTVEEFVQALIMTSVLRSAGFVGGKLNLRRDTEGNIVVEPLIRGTMTSPTGKTYTVIGQRTNNRDGTTNDSLVKVYNNRSTYPQGELGGVVRQQFEARNREAIATALREGRVFNNNKVHTFEYTGINGNPYIIQAFYRNNRQGWDYTVARKHPSGENTGTLGGVVRQNFEAQNRNDIIRLLDDFRANN